MRVCYRLVLLLLLLCLSSNAFAQDQRDPSRGLGEAFNWYTLSLNLNHRMLLPGDARALGPLVVVESEAYGEMILGLNFQDPTTGEYYAACCEADLNGNLNVLELNGPYARPALFAAGPECVAVGAEDGRLYCWLFAANEYPRDVTISRDYLPGSAFAVEVFPSLSTKTDWSNWLISVAYKPTYSDEILVVNIDGNGGSRGGLPPRTCFSTTNALSFTYVPRSNAQWIPYLLYSESNSRSAETYRNSLRIQAVLFSTTEEIWQPTVSVPNRPFAGSLAIEVSENMLPMAMMAYPDRDPYGAFDALDVSYIELRDLPWNANRAQNPTRQRAGLPLRVDDYLVSFIPTPLTALPLVAYSDGAHLGIARINLEPGLPDGLSVAELVRQVGVTELHDGRNVPLFPITAICGTTRGSRGLPEIYWIQDGTVDNPLVSQLFRLRFNPGD